MFSKFLFTRALFQTLSRNYDNRYGQDNMDPDRPELYTTEKEKAQYFQKSGASNGSRQSRIVNLPNQQKHLKKKIILNLVRSEFSKRKPPSSFTAARSVTPNSRIMSTVWPALWRTWASKRATRWPS